MSRCAIGNGILSLFSACRTVLRTAAAAMRARRSVDSSANRVLRELKICHKLEPVVQQVLRHEWGYDVAHPYHGMRVMAIRLMTEELAELEPRTGTGKALLVWGRYISMNNQNCQRSGR